MKDNIIVEFPISEVRQKELAQQFESGQSSSSTGSLYLNKVAFVDELLEMTTVPVLNQYASHGVNIKDKNFQKDFRYALDCMKSAIYRQIGLSHPIQDVMDYMDTEE